MRLGDFSDLWLSRKVKNLTLDSGLQTRRSRLKLIAGFVIEFTV